MKGPQDLSIEELERTAARQLDAGQFRNAVTSCKELQRRDPGPQRLEALARAYEGRGNELTRKGMVKEALAIWRNRHEICGKPLDDPRYLALLAGSDPEQARLLLQQLIPELAGDSERLNLLRRICAAHALGGAEPLLQAWPADDRLHQDLPAAKQALQAYCAGEDADLEEALGAIPFRSPFRELKPIFKALLQFPETPESALRQLERIDPESPFRPLSEGIRRAAQPRRAPASQSALNDFADTLRGWDPPLSAAAAALHREGNGIRPDRLLNLLHRHAKALGPHNVRETAKRLLIQQDALGNRQLAQEHDRLFGRPEPFEVSRVIALMVEVSQDPPEEVLDCWSDTLDNVADARSLAAADKPLAQALILRRMAELAQRHDFLEDEAPEYLAQALEKDPDDRDSHIPLIQLYRKDRNLKAAREIAARAEGRWPDDPAILLESARNAIASNAYKKATRIARQVLELDPVNSQIKALLLDSHLAHARKQIAGRKAHLADRELAQAAEWAATPQARGWCDLLAGISAFVQDAREKAGPLLAQGCERLGPLAGRFALTWQAREFQLVPKTLLRAGGIPAKPGKLQPADLMAVLGEIEALVAAAPHSLTLNEALQNLIPALKAGAKLALEESEWLRACENWRRLPVLRQALLAPYAKAACKRYPRHIGFRFFVIEAQRVPGRALPPPDRNRLLDLLDEARHAGDNRTAGMIARLLTEDDYCRVPYAGFPEPTPLDLPKPPKPPKPNKPEEPDDLQMDLFGDLPDDPSPGLPPGITEDELVDQMLQAGIPTDVKKALKEIGKMTGIDDQREILKLLMNNIEEFGLPMEPDPFDPPTPPRGRRR